MTSTLHGEAIGPVAYFHGQHQLAEAGMLLLEGPPHIQVAIVKGLGTASLYDLSINPDHTQSAIRTLRVAAPGMHRLDRVLAIWSAQHLPEPYQLTGLHSNGIKEGGIGLHHDDSGYQHDHHGAKYDGPLSMSLRVDRHDIERTFYALRTDSPALTIDGVDWQAEKALAWAHDTDYSDPISGTVAVNQEPGDLIMMRNYPYPTLHAVDDPSEAAGEGLTRALLATWRVEYAPPLDSEDFRYLQDGHGW